MLVFFVGSQGWIALLVNPFVAAGFLVDKFTEFQFGLSIAMLIAAVIWFSAMFKNFGHALDASANEWQKEENRQDTLEVAAIEEEHMFRDGAETWTLGQRFRSCWIFAGMHATPWWYGCFFLFLPFAGGVTFMLVYLYTFKKTGSRVLLPEIQRSVKPGTHINSDSWKAYTDLPRRGFEHATVNHLRHEFTNGFVHTQNIESAWSHFKRSIYGVYHQVSKKHLQKYCSEFEFRYNSRGATDYERFVDMFGVINTRVKYADLIGKFVV